MRSALFIGLAGLWLGQIAGCPIALTETTLPGARVTTSLGEFVIELDPEHAPLAVENFLQYVEGDFYDGTVFHRVLRDSLAQGGGLTVGLVQKETRPPIVNESGNGLSNVRGTVAMARTDDPDSATAQFFVNLADNLDLDGGPDAAGYAVFGRVVDGMDVVDQVGELPTEERGGLTDVPVEDVVIDDVERTELTIGSTTVSGARVSTSLGDFVIELYLDYAPLAVENFLQYVDDDFYHGTVFHRVLPESLVQGGGLTADLVEKETRSPIVNESQKGLSNVRGTVAMARTDDPASATAQFFVNLVDNTDLDASSDTPGYAVFGRVVNGMDVVDQIAEIPTAWRDGMTDVPVEDVVINDARRVELTIGSAVRSGVRVSTSLGDFVVELYRDYAPLTVENFLQYVDDDFYQETLFHRVVPDFVVQGGGFTRGLVEKAPAIPVGNESDNGLTNTRGTVALPFEDDPNSATSQFLVNLADNTHFDATVNNPGFTVFGRVVEGLDVVERIAAVATEERAELRSVPVEDIIIEHIEPVELPTGEVGLSPESEAYLESQQYRVGVLLRELLVQTFSLAVARP